MLHVQTLNIIDAFPNIDLKNDMGEAWNLINWTKCRHHVDRIQKSIAKSIECGNFKKAEKLRKVLYASKAAKLIAVRKVTQENRGKSTSGIDGVKNVKPAQRIAMAEMVRVNPKWKPVRQVEIPKKNGKMRTLGIPTMYDRACQALMKIGLEPCYEANAENNSYGFRPCRSAHDAIEKIFLAIRSSKDKWILEGDLKGFFDNIKTNAIIDNVIIGQDHELKHSIIKLVQSGAVSVKHEAIETNKGTPQGSVISPLLANIAFMGLEKMIDEWDWNNRKRTNRKMKRDKKVQVIVYADDFVVIAKEKEIIEELKQVIGKWVMDKMGVELSPEKTKITNINDGFDFLGFNVRQYAIGKNGKVKTLIKPSKDSIKGIKEKIRVVCKGGKSLSQEALISKLNPIIRGWANYYRHGVSKEIYGSVDNYTWKCIWNWCTSRHNNKGKIWVKNKYFDNKWVFQTGKHELYRMSTTKITRFIKVKGSEHPFNGNDDYWNKRMYQNKDMALHTKIIKSQNHKCKWCSQKLVYNDVIEIDHIIPKVLGGTDKLENLQLLHGYCHDRKTAIDGSLNKR